MRRIALALALVLAFGAARLPFEHRLTQEHRAAYFHQANLDLSLRAQIGQFGFLAALSGFRAVVADGLWLQGHSAWEKTEWGRMAYLFNAVCALQPRQLTFWDMSAWHMAWNASVAALNDPHEPRENVRQRAALQYYRLGEDFLLRGIQNNPDRYVLFQSAANLYKDKLGDHLAAASMFAKAATFADSPSYEKRFAAYELSHVPGHEREAYEQLSALFHRGVPEWLPTLLDRLMALQEQLNVPLADAQAMSAAAEEFTHALRSLAAHQRFQTNQLYIIRFQAYELSRLPGREAEALALLDQLSQLSPPETREWSPILRQRYAALQEKLRISPPPRAYNPASSPTPSR